MSLLSAASSSSCSARFSSQSRSAARTTSLEVLGKVEETARVDGLPKAQQAAIEKEIVLMTDPVEKLRLRLALARFEEGQGQALQGAAVIDAVYRENPAILGVVRAAVDYHWRNKNSKRTVDILEEASSRSSRSNRKTPEVSGLSG